MLNVNFYKASKTKNYNFDKDVKVIQVNTKRICLDRSLTFEAFPDKNKKNKRRTKKKQQKTKKNKKNKEKQQKNNKKS